MRTSRPLIAASLLVLLAADPSSAQQQPPSGGAGASAQPTAPAASAMPTSPSTSQAGDTASTAAPAPEMGSAAAQPPAAPSTTSGGSAAVSVTVTVPPTPPAASSQTGGAAPVGDRTNAPTTAAAQPGSPSGDGANAKAQGPAEASAAPSAAGGTESVTAPASLPGSTAGSGGTTAASAATAPAQPGETTASTTPVVPVEPKPDRLVIATVGGAFGDAQAQAVLGPYGKDSGIGIDIVQLDSGSNLDASLDHPAWDAALVPADVAKEACTRGLIEPIDSGRLAPAADGSAATADFLDGGLQTCGVAGAAWSAVVITGPADKADKKARPIATLKDLFDAETFKGKRAFPRNPRFLFEMALMADGIDIPYVYSVLETPGGVERALNKLEPLRDRIVWWTKADEPFKLMASGAASMGIGFSGRAFMESVARGDTQRTIWDGQVYDLDMWVIAKSTRFKSAAAEFVAYASRPDRLAEAAQLFPYGPMRKSAVQLVSNNPTLGIAMRPYLPTEPQNFATALRFDAAWWKAREADYTQKLEAWIAAPPKKN